jgi:hypothetical protein
MADTSAYGPETGFDGWSRWIRTTMVLSTEVTSTYCSEDLGLYIPRRLFPSQGAWHGHRRIVLWMRWKGKSGQIRSP